MKKNPLADYGVDFTPISHHAPFALIQCPLCGGTRFPSLEGTSAWCDACNAQFSADYTAGDPGFCLQCTWDNYDHTGRVPVRYMLPRSPGLCLYFTLKDTADLLDVEPCGTDTCRPGAVRLTDGTTGLRAGLHACHLGTLYDWRLVGRTPASLDHDAGHWQVGGVRWPDSAVVPASYLTGREQALLRVAAYYLPETHSQDAAQLRALAERPVEPLPILMSDLPAASALAAGQAYLLHHWTLRPAASPFEAAFALPVWYVVNLPDPHARADTLDVIAANLCPHCGRPVTPEQWKASDEWGAHASCRRIWAEYGWTPIWEPAKLQPV